MVDVCTVSSDHTLVALTALVAVLADNDMVDGAVLCGVPLLDKLGYGLCCVDRRIGIDFT